MRWELLTTALAVTGVAARVDRLAAMHQARSAAAQSLAHPGVPFDRWTRDAPVEKLFENANTTSGFNHEEVITAHGVLTAAA